MEKFIEDFHHEQLQEDSGIDFMNYIRALIRRFWLIGIVTAAVAVPWIWHLKKQPPVYEAETWISFENVARDVPNNLIGRRIRELKSRSFAEEITAELGLVLSIQSDTLMSHDVFKIFSTTKNPVAGRYSLRFYPSGQCAFYYGSKLLDSVNVKKFIDDTVSYNNLFFSLNPEIVKRSSEVKFLVRDFISTVKSLIAREDIRANNTGTLIKITLRDRNPKLASQTANMLASIFIEKTRQMTRESKRMRLNFLKNQLEEAKKKLNRSDANLRAFRNKHIKGLNQETQDVVNRLDLIDRQIRQLTLSKNELNMLLNQLDITSEDFDVKNDDYLPYIYQQITRMTIFENDDEMAILRAQLMDTKREKDTKYENLPEKNPKVSELIETIHEIENKIYQKANDKIKALDRQIEDMIKQKKDLEAKLSVLPDEEIRQIELNRERQANEEIYKTLLKMVKEAEVSEVTTPESAKIIDPAIPPDKPVTKDTRKKMIIGIFLGLVLGVGIVIVIEEMDKSIKTQQDIKRHVRLPILGIIPKVRFDKYEIQDSEKAKSISSQIVTHDYSPTPVGEAYRYLRTSILFSKGIGEISTLAIGSVLPEEGKSFTAANLSITMAQQKSRTLLVDTDLRRGVLHNTFNCPKKPGLTNHLMGMASMDDVIKETYIPNLKLITCGTLVPNPSELLGSDRMKQFIEEIKREFEIIIFDTPPMAAATDVVILSTLVDGVAFLVRAGRTSRDEIKQKLELFRSVRANILGVILNGAGVEIAHEGYSYYHY